MVRGIKVLSGFFALAAALVLVASPAHADGFSIGGSFDGFGMLSQTDDLGSGIATSGRSQLFFSEIPGVGGGIINQANGVNGNDTDFGLFSANLSLNAQAEVSDNVDIGFRVAFLATGAGDETVGGGGLGVLLEQGFADFHTEDGSMGVLMGRFQPNTGGSLRAIDNGSPFISLSRVALLPTYLTGLVAYFNSGEVGAALYLYNDLNGANDQDDVDLGYGLGAFYTTDEMQAKLTAFLSPEALRGFTVPGEPDNELWVFVINGRLDADMDQIRVFLDATLRREGWPGDAVESVEAYSVAAGATFMATDMFGLGLNAEWIHIADANDSFNSGVGAFVEDPLSPGFANQAFLRDGNIILLSPTVVVDLGNGAGINVGYSLDTSNDHDPGVDRRNIHAIFVQFVAELDSGAKSRTPGVVSVN